MDERADSAYVTRKDHEDLSREGMRQRYLNECALEDVILIYYEIT